MRRLMEWIYATCFGLQIKSYDQHIEDIENRLSDLLLAKHAIDIDINATTRRLLDAHAARDEVNRHRHEWIDTHRADVIDHQFPDVAPRSY